MPTYRAYLIDCTGGPRLSPDEEALETATQLVDGHERGSLAARSRAWTPKAELTALEVVFL
jgi:hypothetical protein